MRQTRSPLDDNLLNPVHRLSSRIGRAFAGELQMRFGLGVAEWRTLLALYHEPGRAAVEIAERWAMDKMAISRAVRRLEADGLVARHANPADQRIRRLELTAKGRALYRRVVPVANRRYHDIVAVLAPEELAVLRDGLRRLVDSTAAPGSSHE